MFLVERCTDGVDSAGAAVEEGARHPGVDQRPGSFFDGIAFADGAQVDLHAGPGKGDGEVGFVERHQMHARPASGLGQGFRVGQAARVAREPPAPHQRRDGQVEGALGFGVQTPGCLQQAKQARLDPHRPLRRPRVDPAYFTGGLVKTQLRVEPLDLGQRFLACRPQPHFVVAVEDEFEAGGHRRQRETDGLHGVWVLRCSSVWVKRTKTP